MKDKCPRCGAMIKVRFNNDDVYMPYKWITCNTCDKTFVKTVDPNKVVTVDSVYGDWEEDNVFHECIMDKGILIL